MEGLSSSFTCSWASCVSMDGSCRSQAALGGAQRQDKRQQAGGSTGRCWLGKQESEFLVMKVGIDLGMHCLEKLWDPRNVKIDWRKLQGSFAYSWVTPVLCMVLDLHKVSYKHTFFSFVLFSLGFDYFLFFFFSPITAWFICKKLGIVLYVFDNFSVGCWLFVTS